MRLQGLLGPDRPNVEHFGELSQTLLCRFLGRVQGGILSRVVGSVVGGVLVGILGDVLGGNQFGVEEDVHYKNRRPIDVGGEVELVAFHQDGDRLLEVLNRAHLNHRRIELHVSWLLRVDRAQVQLVDHSCQRKRVFSLHRLRSHRLELGLAYGDNSNLIN